MKRKNLEIFHTAAQEFVGKDLAQRNNDSEGTECFSLLPSSINPVIHPTFLLEIL